MIIISDDYDDYDYMTIMMKNMYDKRRLFFDSTSIIIKTRLKKFLFQMSSHSKAILIELRFGEKKNLPQYHHQHSQQFRLPDVMSIDLAPGPNLNTFISGVSCLLVSLTMKSPISSCVLLCDPI